MLRNLGAASTWGSLLMMTAAILLAAMTSSNWAQASVCAAQLHVAPVTFGSILRTSTCMGKPVIQMDRLPGF